MKERVERFLVSWLAGGLASALILVAGVVASLRPSGGESHPCWAASLGLSVLAATLLTFARQGAVDRAAERVRDNLERSQQRLENAATGLPDLIRTSPEKNFLWQLGVKFEKCLYVSDAAENVRDLGIALTTCLQAIAELAGDFDNGPPRITYCANLMVFLKPADASSWEPSLTFHETGVAVSSLAGVLALSPVFSGNSKGETPDPKLREFALPVPSELGTEKPKGGTGWNALPGAPFAFLRDDIELFTETTALAAWCHEHGNFKPSITRQVDEYFRANTDITGFLAMPLHEASSEFSEGRRALGVINVHWNRPTRLSTMKAAELFYSALSPLFSLTARTLVAYRQAGGAISPGSPT